MSESFDRTRDKIIPAILATSVPDLELKLTQIPDEIKFVHIDVLEEDIWTDIGIDFEAHLMVGEPEKIIGKWVERGAKRLILHTLGGSTSKLGKVEVGLGVELDTPLEDIFPLVPQVDFIHLMSIDEIGEQGHPFNPEVFDRIKKVKERFPQVPISVDGGINTSNYQALADAGVDRLVVGSGFKDLWNSLMKK